MLSPLLKKLLFVRQFNIFNGKINLLGNEYVLLNGDALLELQEIDNEKFYNLIKDSTLKSLNKIISHARVYKELKSVMFFDVSSLSKKLGPGNEGMLKTVQEIFELYGLGKFEIIKLSNSNKQAEVRIRDSTIAKSYLKKNKKSHKPVCTITAAVLAGIFSFLFQKKVDAIETKCLAKGDSFCLFSVK